MRKRISEKFFTLIITVILALGWEWTDLAKDIFKISDQLRTRILIGLTILLIAKEGYDQLLKPATKINVNEKQDVVKSFFAGLVMKYREEYQRLFHQEAPEIRVSIMLPMVWQKIWVRNLKNQYRLCSTGTSEFENQELDVKWRKKEGPCGIAWVEKRPAVYDEKDPALNKYKFTAEQKEAMKKVKSAISVPLCYNDNVVGVLNIDSLTKGIETTKFRAEDMIALAGRFADSIAPNLFEDGVEEG